MYNAWCYKNTLFVNLKTTSLSINVSAIINILLYYIMFSFSFFFDEAKCITLSSNFARL